MDDLRSAKLIASAILIAAGGICVSLSDHRDGLGTFVGLIFIFVGIPLLVLQWRRGHRPMRREFDDPDSESDTRFKASNDRDI